MSFIQVPTELLQANITSTQFKLCAFIISNSVYNKESEVCACFWGYGKIAQKFTGNQETKAKSSIIKQIKDLVNKGILVIYERSGNKSNGIAFNEDFELGRAQTDVGCLNNTDGCLNNTDGCLNNTLHKDNRFKNIYLKNIQGGCLNNTQENKQNSKDMEAANVVAARSMHKAGEPAENQQKGVQATEYEFTIEDLELFESIKDILIDKNNYYFIQFFKVNEIYGFRPVGAVSVKTADTISQSIIDAAEKIGRILTFVPFDTKYNGEIIIDFQQLITKGE